MQNTLIGSERRYFELAARAPVGIYLVSPRGECFEANPRLCELTGMSYEQLRALAGSGDCTPRISGA
jgi:PAS domain S-box-containing protein